MTFQNKTVWITGASSGIGAQLAREFASQGANLVLSARREAQLQEIGAQCRRGKNRVTIVALDLTQTAQIEGVAKDVLREIGPIDILVHSAGISQRSLAKDTVLEVNRKLMELNFFAAVELTRCVLPSMLARQSGHVLVVSSVAGKFGSPMRTGYAASKHALHGYFDSLRAEIFAQGVKVSIACPGYIQTEITLNSLVGDGSNYGKVDTALAHGMPVDVCARRIVRGIARGENEFVVSHAREKLAVGLSRFVPGIFSRIIRNIKPS